MWKYLHLIALGILCTPAQAAAQECEDSQGARGIALLIGISDYRAPAGAEPQASWARLNNAVNDVDHVCRALHQADFGTITLRDPTFEEIDTALVDFQLAASQGDHAVVYFAGHGFEFDGQSYLVPVNAPVASSRETIAGDFVPMQRLLDAASAAGEFGLFLMDACRTRNPVVSVTDAGAQAAGVSPLGLFTVPRGAVIFSTVSGRPAYDEAPVGSQTSPFASSIAEGMQVPGLELGAFYSFLHENIVQQTEGMQPAGAQFPALYKITPANFYLVQPTSPISAAAAESSSLTLPSLDRLAIEDEPQLLRELLENHSIAELAAAARAGDPTAQYLLGYAYNFGIALREDDREARRWLEGSAAQGHPGGQTDLAFLLQQQAADTALPETERQALAAEALALYEQAVAQGYAKAQSHLGSALWWGSLGPQDRARAVGLFEGAASAGHVWATFALGLYGEGMLASAQARLRQIAASGNPEGNNWLCELHYHANALPHAARGGAQIEDCEIAALNNYAGARVIYAQALANGWGADPSPREAGYWARLALAQPELSTRQGLVDIATALTE